MVYLDKHSLVDELKRDNKSLRNYIKRMSFRNKELKSELEMYKILTFTFLFIVVALVMVIAFVIT